MGEATVNSANNMSKSISDLSVAMKILIGMQQKAQKATDDAAKALEMKSKGLNEYGKAVNKAGEELANWNKRTHILSATIKELNKSGNRMELFSSLGTYRKEGGNILEYLAEFMSGAREELTVFGFEAAKARKVMYGFLPPGMFRMMNKMSSAFQFFGGIIRKMGDSAEESDNIFMKMGKGISKVFKPTFSKDTEALAGMMGNEGTLKNFKLKMKLHKAEKKEKMKAWNDARKLRKGKRSALKADNKRQLKELKEALKNEIEERITAANAVQEYKNLAKSEVGSFNAFGGSLTDWQDAIDAKMDEYRGLDGVDLSEREGKLQGSKDKISNMQGQKESLLKKAEKIKAASPFRMKANKLMKFAKTIAPKIGLFLKSAIFGMAYFLMLFIATIIVLKAIWPSIKKGFGMAKKVVTSGILLLKEGFTQVWEGLSGIFDFIFGDASLGDLLDSMWVLLKGLFKIAWGIIVIIVGGLIAIVVGIMADLLSKALTWVKNLKMDMASFKKIIKLVVVTIAIIAMFIFGWAPILIAAAAIMIWKFGGWIVKKFKKLIPGNAEGGVVSGLSIVGEKGPELVSFGSTARVHSNADSKKMIGGGGTVNNFNITINAKDTSDTEMRRIADKIGNMVSNKINRRTSSGTMS